MSLQSECLGYLTTGHGIIGHVNTVITWYVTMDTHKRTSSTMKQRMTKKVILNFAHVLLSGRAQLALYKLLDVIERTGRRPRLFHKSQNVLYIMLIALKSTTTRLAKEVFEKLESNHCV